MKMKILIYNAPNVFEQAVEKAKEYKAKIEAMDDYEFSEFLEENVKMFLTSKMTRAEAVESWVAVTDFPEEDLNNTRCYDPVEVEI